VGDYSPLNIMNVFVNKSKRINVEVFVWEQGDVIGASSDKSNVPESIEDIHVQNFVFRKPNYGDTTGIIRQALETGQEGNTRDLFQFQDVVLRTMLVDWDLKNEEGKPVSIKGNINQLEPAVAQAAVAGYFNKVSFA
jgi:hypothetical protein